MPNTKHKIIHLTTVHYPYDTRILRRECVTLAEKEEYDVQLLNGYGVNDTFKGVKLTSFDNKKRGRFGRMLIRGWLAFISTKRKKPHICHIHDPEIIWIGWLLQFFGTKAIYDAHEDYSQKIKSKHWLPKPLRLISSNLYSSLSNFFVQRFEAVISATESIAEKHPCKRNYTIHNFPRFGELSQNDKQIQRASNQIVYTGGLTAQRGIKQVLQALCEHCPSNWHLVIVGKSTSAVKKELRNYLEDPRVEYRGEVPFEDVKMLLQESEIGTVCNQPGFDYENALPNKLFEYMASGLLVVCSNFKKWKEIVEGTESGLTCNTENPFELGALFNYIFENPDLIQKLGSNGPQTIQKNYSWEKESEKLLQLYEDILDEH